MYGETAIRSKEKRNYNSCISDGSSSYYSLPVFRRMPGQELMRRCPGESTETFRLAILGLIVIVLFYRSAKEHKDRDFRWMWLTIVLSFGFYIPVVLWADTVPAVGMLMIPKTCAYVWTVMIGYQAMRKTAR